MLDCRGSRHRPAAPNLALAQVNGSTWIPILIPLFRSSASSQGTPAAAANSQAATCLASSRADSPRSIWKGTEISGNFNGRAAWRAWKTRGQGPGAGRRTGPRPGPWAGIELPRRQGTGQAHRDAGPGRLPAGLGALWPPARHGGPASGCRHARVAALRLAGPNAV